mmetsp:Transcript_9725/g.30035  ORF Transcript_9725/g.30035 Transcript_9725/m.30035 type:complete len:213 (-) Transcript_9725:273-911(-)
MERSTSGPRRRRPSKRRRRSPLSAFHRTLTTIDRNCRHHRPGSEPPWPPTERITSPLDRSFRCLTRAPQTHSIARHGARTSCPSNTASSTRPWASTSRRGLRRVNLSRRIAMMHGARRRSRPRSLGRAFLQDSRDSLTATRFASKLRPPKLCRRRRFPDSKVPHIPGWRLRSTAWSTRMAKTSTRGPAKRTRSLLTWPVNLVALANWPCKQP